jgi:hypothetical protein
MMVLACRGGNVRRIFIGLHVSYVCDFYGRPYEGHSISAGLIRTSWAMTQRIFRWTPKASKKLLISSDYASSIK